MGPAESGLVHAYDQVHRRLINGNGAPKKDTQKQPQSEIDDLMACMKVDIEALTTEHQFQITTLTNRLIKVEGQLNSILSPQSTALEKVIMVEDVIRLVCCHEQIRRNILVGYRRSVDICFARHLVCYLSANLTSRSLKQIGDKLGGKDHTSVLHGIDKLEENRKNDMQLDARLSFYEDLLYRETH